VPVPKRLGSVRKEWNPRTVLISFKLETDSKILESKARGAIAKYDVDMVVANELKSRRSKVTMYMKDGGSTDIKMEEGEETQVDQISQKIVHFIRERLGFIRREQE